MSTGCAELFLGVEGHGAVDHLRDLAFERSHGLLSAVAGIESTPKVILSLAWSDGLDMGCEMDRVVELPVPTS